METFAEPIRYATTLCAIALTITAARMLRGDPRERLPLLRVVVPWLAIAAAAGLFFSHVTRSVPAPALVPAGALIGLGLGIAALCSPRVAARFTALDDGQWRMLMLFRAVFGA